MSEKTFKKIFVSVIILSLLFLFSLTLSSLNVSAFEVKGEQVSSALCPRDIGEFTDFVVNTNDVYKEFSINLRGDASQWASVVLNPTPMVLGPGQQGKISTYVTPRLDSKPGEYSLEIVVNAGGESKVIKHTVIVRDCYSAKLWAVQTEKKVCPGDLVQYEFYLKNEGEYRDSFKLSVEGQLKDAVSLSDTVVVLDKGESKKVVAYLKASDDAGNYGFSVVVSGKKAVKSLRFGLIVNPCYDFLVNVLGNNSYDFCEHTAISVPIEIENRGSVINDFELRAKGPVWVRLDRNALTLGPGEKAKVNLIFAPNYGIVGDFDIGVEVNPSKGALKARSEFKLHVRKCHSISVDVIGDELTACKEASTKFDIIVVNDGEVNKDFKLEVDGPKWITTRNPQTFSLIADMERKILFSADPTADAEAKNYEFKVRISALDDSGVSGEDRVKIKVAEAKDCFKPGIATQYDAVAVYVDDTVTMPVAIRNDGLRTAEYNLFLSGSAANFVRLNQNFISVEPGQSKIVYLYIAPGPEIKLGAYKMVLTLNLKNGPFLATKNIDLEVTDVREKVTPVAAEWPAKESGETSAEIVSPWDRFKAWLKDVLKTSPDTGAETVEDNKGIDVGLSEGEKKFGGVEGAIKEYKNYILVGIIILAILIILIKVNFFKKFMDFFEEGFEDEEEEEWLEDEKEKEEKVEKKKPEKKKAQ